MKSDRLTFRVRVLHHGSKAGAAVAAWAVAVLATAISITAGIPERPALLSLFLTIPVLYFLFAIAFDREQEHAPSSVLDHDKRLDAQSFLATTTFRALESLTPPDVLSRRSHLESSRPIQPKLIAAYRDVVKVLAHQANRSVLWSAYLSIFLGIARAADMLARLSTHWISPKARRDEAWHRVLYSREAAEKFRTDVSMCPWEGDVEEEYMRAATEIVKEMLTGENERSRLMRVEGSDKVFYILLADPPKLTAAVTQSNDSQPSLFENRG